MAGSAKLANAGVRIQAHSVTGARREVRAPREVRTPDAPLRANMANKERAIDEKRAPMTVRRLSFAPKSGGTWCAFERVLTRVRAPLYPIGQCQWTPVGRLSGNRHHPAASTRCTLPLCLGLRFPFGHSCWTRDPWLRFSHEKVKIVLSRVTSRPLHHQAPPDLALYNQPNSPHPSQPSLIPSTSPLLYPVLCTTSLL